MCLRISWSNSATVAAEVHTPPFTSSITAVTLRRFSLFPRLGARGASGGEGRASAVASTGREARAACSSQYQQGV